MSAEEAEVRVTGPRGPTDTEDTPMPKDPGRTGHVDASLQVRVSVPGAVPEVGRGEDLHS